MEDKDDHSDLIETLQILACVGILWALLVYLWNWMAEDDVHPLLQIIYCLLTIAVIVIIGSVFYAIFIK
jgi:hypothetical protein